ncbi:MAG: DUF4279 domain-containing protein [Xenococcaceae cyanobacterium]
METNEGEVYFALDGYDFNPDEVTEFLGVKPTSVVRKGERIPDRFPKFSSWKFSTGKEIDDYIDVFLMALSITETLSPKTDLILEAIDKFRVKPRLEVVLWFSADENVPTPAIGFEVSSVQFLGKIGAFIDIDTYKH